MSRTLTIQSHWPVSPETLIGLLSDPEFLAARHKVRGALEASVREVLREGSRWRQEVQATEFAHGVKGVDQSRTERTVTTYDWDMETLSCHWRYHGPHDKLVSLEGTMRIERSEGGAHLIASSSISAKIPLVGSMIEKRAMEDLERGQKQVDALVAQFLDRTVPRTSR
jgi:hypothetical protein